MIQKQKPGRRLLRRSHRTRRAILDLGILFSGKTARERREGGDRLTVTLAVAVLAIMSVLSFCLPLRPDYSETEMRSLSRFPVPTVSTFLSGEFFAGVDIWFADTFPFREQFMALSDRMESFYGQRSEMIHGDVQAGDAIPPSDEGFDEPLSPTISPVDEILDESLSLVMPPNDAIGDKTSTGDDVDDVCSNMPEDTPVIPDIDENAKIETLGALLVINDAAYEYYNFVATIAQDYIITVQKAADQISGQANVYNLLIPNSMDICVPDRIRSQITTSSQREAIDFFYASYDENVETVDVYNSLLRASVDGEYIYFRTDHHWTALGAYYAYCDFAEAADRKVANLKTDFNERVFSGFLGSFYRKTKNTAMAANPDTLYAFEPKSTNDIQIHWANGGVSMYNIVTDVTDWAAGSKYASGFIGGDNPYSIIQNPNITDGSAIVLVKDSYGNCFAPFLAESYQYVYVVDFRYYDDSEIGTLADLVREKDVDDVLIINAISTTRSSGLVKQLTRFVG